MKEINISNEVIHRLLFGVAMHLVRVEMGEMNLVSFCLCFHSPIFLYLVKQPGRFFKRVAVNNHLFRTSINTSGFYCIVIPPAFNPVKFSVISKTLNDIS